MKVPSKEELPLHAPDQPVHIDETRLSAFRRAFRKTSKKTPPTLGAVGLQGVFKIVNQLEVDWRNLLHATQSFHYHEPVTAPTDVVFKTKLADCKFRAGMYWLQFESDMVDSATQKPLLSLKSLLMVKA